MSCIMTPILKDTPCCFDPSEAQAIQKLIQSQLDKIAEAVEDNIKIILSNDGYVGAYTKRQLKKAGYSIEHTYDSVNRHDIYRVFKKKEFIGGFYIDLNSDNSHLKFSKP